MLVSESSPREQTSRFRRALRLGLLACIGVCVLIIAVVYTSTRGSNMHTSALPGHSDLRSTPAAQPTSEAASEDSSDCPLTYVRPSYRELKEHVVRPYVFGVSTASFLCQLPHGSGTTRLIESGDHAIISQRSILEPMQTDFSPLTMTELMGLRGTESSPVTIKEPLGLRGTGLFSPVFALFKPASSLLSRPWELTFPLHPIAECSPTHGDGDTATQGKFCGYAPGGRPMCPKVGPAAYVSCMARLHQPPMTVCTQTKVQIHHDCWCRLRP